MKNKFIAASVLAAAAPVAHAVPVTVSDSITLNSLLTQGSAGQTVAFDLNTALSSAGIQAGSVTSAVLTAYGYSDLSLQAGPTTYSAYSQTGGTTRLVSPGYSYQTGCSFWGGCNYVYVPPVYAYDSTHTRYAETHNTDNVADVMSMTVGGTTASDIASETLNQYTPYIGPIYEGTGGSSYNGYQYYQRYQREHNTGIYGALEISIALDALALADLWTDGILNAFLSSPTGQLRLTGLSITAIGDDEWNAPHSVPEPETFVLFASGLLMLQMTIRRRRKDS